MASPRWTADELDVLRRLYPTGGARAVHAALPHRSLGVIKVIAHRRGVTCDVHYGQKPRFSLADILRAYRECDGNAVRAAKLIG